MVPLIAAVSAARAPGGGALEFSAGPTRPTAAAVNAATDSAAAPELDIVAAAAAAAVGASTAAPEAETAADRIDARNGRGGRADAAAAVAGTRTAPCGGTEAAATMATGGDGSVEDADERADANAGANKVCADKGAAAVA